MRFHNWEEQRVMLRRSKEEYRKHHYEWNGRPKEKPDECECLKGIGIMRRRRVWGCMDRHCSYCGIKKAMHIEENKRARRIIRVRLRIKFDGVDLW